MNIVKVDDVNVSRMHDDRICIISFSMAIPGNELPWEEPKIAESVLIRMGMIIQLKEVISSAYLLKQQRRLSVMMAERLESMENLICLGPKPAHLSVLAFVVRNPLSGIRFVLTRKYSWK